MTPVPNARANAPHFHTACLVPEGPAPSDPWGWRVFAIERTPPGRHGGRPSGKTDVGSELRFPSAGLAAGLVVSIHDVSPLTFRVVDAMLDDLERLGVRRTSLLVVPNHHRRGHFLEDAAFCEWLRDRAADGHEAVIHGYFHLRERVAADGLFKRFVTESYTAGEGEFFDLGREEASRRVSRAREEFERAGLHPIGFIAPAWLLGSEAAGALKALGLQYTTRLGTVEDLRDGRAYASQSLVYSVRSAWRRAASLGWNSFLLRRLGRIPLIRVGLHPPDWSHPAIRDHARNCIVRALAGREAIPYDTWLERQRSLSET